MIEIGIRELLLLPKAESRIPTTLPNVGRALYAAGYLLALWLLGTFPIGGDGSGDHSPGAPAVWAKLIAAAHTNPATINNPRARITLIRILMKHFVDMRSPATPRMPHSKYELCVPPATFPAAPPIGVIRRNEPTAKRKPAASCRSLAGGSPAPTLARAKLTSSRRRRRPAWPRTACLSPDR